MKYYIIILLTIFLNSCTNTSFNQLSSDIDVNVQANLNANVKVGEKISGTGSESSFLWIFRVPGVKYRSSGASTSMTSSFPAGNNILSQQCDSSTPKLVGTYNWTSIKVEKISSGYIVTYTPDGKPHPSNTRVTAVERFSKKPELQPMFGIEQEFFLVQQDSNMNFLVQQEFLKFFCKF